MGRGCRLNSMHRPSHSFSHSFTLSFTSLSLSLHLPSRPLSPSLSHSTFLSLSLFALCSRLIHTLSFSHTHTLSSLSIPLSPPLPLSPSHCPSTFLSLSVFALILSLSLCHTPTLSSFSMASLSLSPSISPSLLFLARAEYRRLSEISPHSPAPYSFYSLPPPPLPLSLPRSAPYLAIELFQSQCPLLFPSHFTPSSTPPNFYFCYCPYFHPLPASPRLLFSVTVQRVHARQSGVHTQF